MADSKGNIEKIVKSTTGLITLDADWDGTASAICEVDGDLPIVGLLIKLSDTGTVTITIEENGLSYDLYAADGITVVTLGDGTDVNIARFMPELAPFSKFKLTCSASQTNATVHGMLAS